MVDGGTSGFSGLFERMLASWQEAGFFNYVFPFLLIFALIFGILGRIKIFKENKAINAIIALVAALMSLQFSFVPVFFSQLFPRLGVGLVVILAILIIVGLFTDPESNFMNYILLAVGAVVVIVVLVQTAGATGWASGEWWSSNWEVVAGIIGILVVIGIIIAASSPKSEKKNYKGILFRE